jgi:hypothetical protein
VKKLAVKKLAVKKLAVKKLAVKKLAVDSGGSCQFASSHRSPVGTVSFAALRKRVGWWRRRKSVEEVRSSAERRERGGLCGATGTRNIRLLVPPVSGGIEIFCRSCGREWAGGDDAGASKRCVTARSDGNEEGYAEHWNEEGYEGRRER